MLYNNPTYKSFLFCFDNLSFRNEVAVQSSGTSQTGDNFQAGNLLFIYLLLLQVGWVLYGVALLIYFVSKPAFLIKRVKQQKNYLFSIAYLFY